jgi:hypothetical protein
MRGYVIKKLTVYVAKCGTSFVEVKNRFAEKLFRRFFVSANFLWQIVNKEVLMNDKETFSHNSIFYKYILFI